MSATRTKATANRRRPASTPPPRRLWPWLALGALVVLAAVIAFVASDGGEPPASSPGLEETRPVEVSGTALAPMGTGTDAAIGQVVPVVSGATFDGTPMTIGANGRAAVITFVAHWCPHCQREVPLLRDHLASQSMPEGVDLLTVATSTRSDRPNYPPSAWLDKEAWPGLVLADSADGTAAQAFGLTAFPYFVAVNADGEVVARASGEISTDQFDQLVALAQGSGGP